MAEAVHLLLICATQVLKELSRSGKPSRSGITDAAIDVRARCVILNQGKNIIEAIRLLNDILQGIQPRQKKNASLLRHLHW